jgi:hypothetical protein
MWPLPWTISRNDPSIFLCDVPTILCTMGTGYSRFGVRDPQFRNFWHRIFVFGDPSFFDTASSGSFPDFLAIYFDNAVILSVVALDSSVGIAVLIQAAHSGDRIPVETRLSAPVQTDPGAHPGYLAFPGAWRCPLNPHLTPRLKKE